MELGFTSDTFKATFDPPAAWTTRPRVVVIFEEATLADSGSKPDEKERRLCEERTENNQTTKRPSPDRPSVL